VIPRDIFARAVRGVLVTLFLGVTAATAAPLRGGELVHLDVYLPLQHQAELDSLLQALHDPSSAQFRQWLTPEQFMEKFGPSHEDIAQVGAALTAHGFGVVRTTAHGLRVVGTAAAVQSYLGASVEAASGPGGRTTFKAKQVSAPPAEIAATGARILAVGALPPHRVHHKSLGEVPDNRYGPDGPYWADDLKQAYDFPSYQALTGKGRTIAIVMASDFLDADMAEYFGHEHLAVPNFVRVPVCVPFEPPPAAPVCGAPWDFNSGATFEVTLDLQQSGGMAPQATIKLYNIPDLSDQSVLQAYQEIVDGNTADIVSSSFGEAEAFYLPAYNQGQDFTSILQQYEDLFKQGNAQGITFVASSGDSGGLGLPSVNYLFPDGNTPVFLPGVETPAASPEVTAVGGTNLVTTFTAGSLDSKYVAENAFGDPEVPYDPYGVGQNVSGGYWGSGGGVSVIFGKPLYQYLVPTGAKMRAVPDISLQMGGCPGGISELPCPQDPTSARSFSILAFAFGTPNQGLYGVIGTSISAPGFAGLLALEEQYLGGKRLGNVNLQIYALAALQGTGSHGPFAGIFHRNIPGFNGAESSGGPGYNQVLGAGTPDVRKFILAPQLPAAGTPQTPSNP
jgi:subtilase family serine protease